MDWTRKKDLEMLAEARKNARTTGERERYEKMADKIINTSIPIQSLRDEMVRAILAGDELKVKRIMDHIHAVRLEETNGHSWGNVKREEIDKSE